MWAELGSLPQNSLTDATLATDENLVVVSGVAVRIWLRLSADGAAKFLPWNACCKVIGCKNVSEGVSQKKGAIYDHTCLTVLDVLPEDPELGVVLKGDKAALSRGTDLSANHSTALTNQSTQSVCV